MVLLETIICCCKPFLFRTLFLPGKHSLWQDRHSGSTFADIKGEVGSRGGAVSAAGGAEIDEFLQNDPTIVWPSSEALGTLPVEFRKAARGKQPYYINHVKGSARCLQALMRCCVRDHPPFAPREGVGAALG